MSKHNPITLLDQPHDQPSLGADVQRINAARLAERRRTMKWLSSALLSGWATQLLAASGMAGAGKAVSDTASTNSSNCSAIPDETEGPFPGDGSRNFQQHPNALALSGIERYDIRRSLPPAQGVATGVPLTLTLTLVDAENACQPLAGHAIYLWHCTQDGNYSMYSQPIAQENYLRGLQVSNAAGQVSFSTIFPGCYDGRWPHIHFEIYRSRESALNDDQTGDYIKVSQLALPQALCAEVYGTVPGYGNSLNNLQAMTLASDNIFGEDQAVRQMATVSGTLAGGLIATLTVPIETKPATIANRPRPAGPPHDPQQGPPPGPKGKSPPSGLPTPLQN